MKKFLIIMLCLATTGLWAQSTEFGIKGTKVTIKGRAKSNNRVAALMRNFDASDWFADPNLIKVQSVQEGSNEFEVTMTRIRPSSDDEGEG